MPSPLRPKWWSRAVDPRLPLAVIVIIGFMVYMAFMGITSAIGIVLDHGSLSQVAQYLLCTVVYALPAWGLAKIKRWAWRFEIGWSFLMVALGAVVLVWSVVAGVFIIVTHGLIARYLLAKRCRELYNPPLYDRP